MKAAIYQNLGLVRKIHWWVALLALFTSGTMLRAQKALYVQQGKELFRVVDFRDEEPYYYNDGKLVVAKATPAGFIYAMRKEELYSPLMVQVKDINVYTKGISFNDSRSVVNKEFGFAAQFVAAYPLSAAFVALELGAKGEMDSILVVSLGKMKPWSVKNARVHAYFKQDFELDIYTLHVFVAGEEVLNSEMPPDVVEAERMKIIQAGVAGVTSAPPKPILAPAPEYPKALKKSGAKGSASVACTISAEGQVIDPVIREATNPEFGAAALAAVQQWRFLPRMKDGKPARAKITLPFQFTPSDEKD